MAISTKFTHADLLVMPDDLKRREIIDRDMFTTTSPTCRHQFISGNILFAFSRYLEVHAVGEIAVARPCFPVLLWPSAISSNHS